MNRYLQALAQAAGWPEPADPGLDATPRPRARFEGWDEAWEEAPSPWGEASAEVEAAVPLPPPDRANPPVLVPPIPETRAPITPTALVAPEAAREVPPPAVPGPAPEPTRAKPLPSALPQPSAPLVTPAVIQMPRLPAPPPLAARTIPAPQAAPSPPDVPAPVLAAPLPEAATPPPAVAVRPAEPVQVTARPVAQPQEPAPSVVPPPAVDPPPAFTIEIGRIEIRLDAPAAPPSERRQAEPPVLTLADYLSQTGRRPA